MAYEEANVAEKRGFETLSVHAGEELARAGRSVSAPIYQSSTFLSAEDGAYHDIRYTRLNNTPGHLALHRKLAELEGADGALSFGSGMAAISSAFAAILQPGDHALAQRCLYGGTYGFLAGEGKQLGIEYTLVDGDRPETWEKALRPNTKAFYVESISNPLMEVPELAAVAEFARGKDLVSMIDNTFTSPYNFRPAELGFDLVLHSATKYLNGHTDVIAGAAMGRAELIQKMKKKLAHFGGCLDPNSCFLLNRGVKTLSLRVERQNENALRLAQFLEALPQVKKVNYPGLASSPHHARAKRWFKGFGGMLSFELAAQGRDAVRAFLSRLKIPMHAPSLGGVESLVVVPAESSHAGQSREELEKIGLSPELIRVSVGIETFEDLRADFAQALSRG